MFRVNYHNQFYAAYSDTNSLNQIKRIWLDSLTRFTPEQIMRGAKRAIESSEYLPTMHKMLRFCEGDLADFGLPEPHSAYVEACRAPSPKASHPWSHAAVYYAGQATDWYFLASNNEAKVFPIFAQHYKHYCERIINGEILAPPETPALPETIETPLTKEENIERLDALKQSLEWD